MDTRCIRIGFKINCTQKEPKLCDASRPASPTRRFEEGKHVVLYINPYIHAINAT